MGFRADVLRALEGALGADVAAAGDLDAALTTPPKIEMGDLAFPCFALAKVKKKAPPAIAAELAATIAPTGAIAKVQALGPFVNFHADPAKQLDDLCQRLVDGRFDAEARTDAPARVMIEFSQPNTHKLFHVGHLRNVVLGDALVRAFRARGHDVVAANYYGDFGIDVAKCLWWIRTHPEETVPVEHRIAWLGSCYVRATQLVAELEASDPEKATTTKASIREVLRGMEEGDPDIRALYEETRQWCLDGFQAIYDQLDVRFDHDFFESQVEHEGQAIVDEQLAKGVFVESQGAIICDLTEEGLGACLVRKGDGASLYMTWDLALARRKFDDFDVERSMYVVGSEQRHHFQQLFATLARMGYERAKDCRHVAYELVMLPSGKMSSRKGTAIPLHVLWDTVRDAIRTRMESEGRDERAGWDATRWNETVERVVVACLKYGMLHVTNNRRVVFDVEAWTNPEGDTGAYLLYALARIAGIQRKAEGPVPTLADGVKDGGSSEGEVFGHETERALLGHLLTWPDVLARMESTCEPAVVATFLFDATKLFSRFYAACPILKAPEPLRTARLQLVNATEAVLRRGFEVLGLPVVDAM
ncbi:MAG: arginine--tRNA ligase [Planctomycetota bacterium]